MGMLPQKSSCLLNDRAVAPRKGWDHKHWILITQMDFSVVAPRRRTTPQGSEHTVYSRLEVSRTRINESLVQHGVLREDSGSGL